MPLDPRIAMSVQPPQIESPMNVMANALKLRAMQNENALFEQQQRQAAMQAEEQNRLRSLLAGGASAEQLMRSGFFEQGAKLGEFGRQQSAEERAQAEEARKAEEAAASRRKAMFGVLSVAKNPETYRTAREIAQGMGLDLTGIPEEFPGVQYINTLEDSLLTPQERAERAAKARTASIQEGQLDVSRGNLAVSRAELAFRQQKEAREARESAATTAGIAPPAKLKPGERWNPEAGRVEAVPGSELYVKQSRIHAADHSTLTGIRKQKDLANSKIDKLLDEKNTSAFNNLFGGYTAYATQQFSGETANLKSSLDSLKSSLKTAGLQLIKQGSGQSIGQITEREWPILEGMIDTLLPTMTAEEARARLAEIKTFMESLERSAIEEYEIAWGDTQFKRDVDMPGAKGASSDGGIVQVRTAEEARALPPGTRFKTPDGRIKVR